MDCCQLLQDNKGSFILTKLHKAIKQGNGDTRRPNLGKRIDLGGLARGIDGTENGGIYGEIFFDVGSLNELDVSIGLANDGIRRYADTVRRIEAGLQVRLDLMQQVSLHLRIGDDGLNQCHIYSISKGDLDSC